jgi:hypothetical protein
MNDYKIMPNKINKITELFYNLIKKYASVDVTIDWSDADNFIKNELNQIADSSRDRYDFLFNFSLSEDDAINKINNSNISNKDAWIEAIRSVDEDKAFNLYLESIRLKNINHKELRNVVNYIESKNLSESNVYSLDEIEQYFIKIKEKLENNFNKLKNIILNSISRISSWNGSSVRIIPNISRDDIKTYESNNFNDFNAFAQIEIINKKNQDNNPYFSIFLEQEKITIDDKLELGDEDFFTSTDASSDYFSLIQELENPGSSSKSKNITLYTARPAEHRELLLENNKLPAGIFLTKSLDFAENFGSEYGQERDVWKVKLNLKDLVQTFSGQGQEQYQLIREVTPILMQML